MAPISSNKKRTEIIELLIALSVKIFQETKLPDDKLEICFMRAVNNVQYLTLAVPSPPLSPKSLADWGDDTSTLPDWMARINAQQTTLAIRELKQQRPMKPKYSDTLHDLQQFTISCALNWAKGVRCCIVESVNSELWAINIRYV